MTTRAELVFGPLLVLGGAVTWWISDQLIVIGPFDRAQIGWAVVVPLLALGPAVTGLAARKPELSRQSRLVGMTTAGLAGLWVLAAAVPVAVVVLVMAVLQPTARRLRLMGWSLVAANLCSLIAVVTALKIIQDFESVEPTLPFPMF